MNVINGKILIFTDLHLGLQSNNVSKLNIAIKIIKQIISYVKQHNIKNILFLGDWHHSRVTTENNILNASYKLMSALQQVASIKLIVGNHDIYMKNSIDVNSLVIFKDLPNVEIIDSVKIVSINNKKAILVPWLGDVSNFNKNEFDMMFGHFDVSSKYLIQTYIDEHQNSLKANCKNNTENLVGDFIDILKDNGIAFSGHIHGHREFIAKGKKFIFVGSPYQQNLGEIDNSCGFYVLNEDMSYDFHELLSIPKFIKLYISKIIHSIDTFDFSIVKGNIVQKIYDIEVDKLLDAQISQKILDMNPYEEILPEYMIEAKSSVNDATTSESIQLLKKSKFEYMRNYVDKIDENAMSADFSKKDLIDVLEKYYNMVI